MLGNTPRRQSMLSGLLNRVFYPARSVLKHHIVCELRRIENDTQIVYELQYLQVSTTFRLIKNIVAFSVQ